MHDLRHQLLMWTLLHWQISEKLGLLHVSKGDGCERHIEVFKAASGHLPADTNRMNSVASNSLFSDICSSRCESNNDVMLSQVFDNDDTENSHFDEHSYGSQQSSTDLPEQVGLNTLTEAADLPSETSSAMSTLCCSNCGQQIPQANFLLHSSRCKSPVVKSSGKKSKDKSCNKVIYLLFGINGYLCKKIYFK